MAILLFGANGMVGCELRSSLSPLGEVVAFDRLEADLRSPNTLRDLIRSYRPTVIVNAAAYTAVDRAETDSDAAFAVNAVAPGVIAEEAEALGATLVHYSTDYVFDGSKTIPYVETDVPKPISAYGSSKLAGENAVWVCRKTIIFRTSWVISEGGNNFVKTILRLAKERPRLRVVADQRGAPTPAALIAKVTAEVLNEMGRSSSADPRWGLYHLVSRGRTTWHGLACYVIDRAASKGMPLQASRQSIAAIMTSEYPTAARRPANSQLATDKITSTFDVVLPTWEVGVDSILEKLVAEIR